MKFSKFVMINLLIISLISINLFQVDAKVVKYDTRVAYLKDIPSQEKWNSLLKMHNGDYFEENNNQIKIWNDYFSSLLSNKPKTPTNKILFKSKSQKNKIKLFTNIRGTYEIKYSTKKNFKNSKTIYTNKKKYTLRKLKKKQKYYIKMRLFKKYYYVTNYEVNIYGTGDNTRYVINFEFFDFLYDTFKEGYVYGPWSKTHKVKTK